MAEIQKARQGHEPIRNMAGFYEPNAEGRSRKMEKTEWEESRARQLEWLRKQENVNMGEQMENEMLTEQEVAEILRVKKQTIAAWRCRGKDCPPSVKCGQRNLYPKKALQDWINQKRQERK